MINGIIALFLLYYIGRWLFSSTTTGQIIPPIHPDRIQVTYSVNGKEYRGSYLRSDVPLRNKNVTLRYLNNNPSVSRVNSFLGIYAEPLAWWGIFLFASFLLFFTNNAVFSKGTTFYVQKKYPWIYMEEYFPVKTKYKWFDSASGKASPDKERLN